MTKTKIHIIFYLLFALAYSGCDINPLGGNVSKIDNQYEPGKRLPSEPPFINPIADFTMDENDVQTIGFTIGDPDTFLMCSNIYVKVNSSNTTLIDYNGFMVSGVYPNCQLTIQPKSFQFGTANVSVEVFDFFTVVKTTFVLTVEHVLAPGFFSITDAIGSNQSVLVEWSNAAYMSGSSAFYSLYYRTTGSTGAYNILSPATSPRLVTGLDNGESYDFFIRAQNSIGTRDTAIVQATPSRFRIYGAEFVPGSTQAEISAGGAPTLTHATTADKTEEVFTVTPSTRYRIYMNSQGNILSGVSP